MTLSELEQRLAALKDEQDKLTAEIERLKAEQAEVKPWRAERGNCYYALGTNHDIVGVREMTDNFDSGNYSVGNYYRTRELAEQDAKELALRGRIRQLRDAMCEGYQLEINKECYSILYNHSTKRFFAECVNNVTSVAEIVFDTVEHAQTACDILNAERNKEV